MPQTTKACKNCRYLVESEKVCPKCNGELSEKFSGTIIVVDSEKSEIANIRMRIFNSDGSEAEMCGNGARCAALYISRSSFVVQYGF